MISYKKIDEKEQILESLGEIALLIMLVDLSQDTFRVIHTGNDDYFHNLRSGSFQWFIQCYMKRHTSEDSYRKLDLLYHQFFKKRKESECRNELELKLVEKEKTHWIRMQFIRGKKDHGTSDKITIIVQNIDEIKYRNKRQQEEIRERHIKDNQARSTFLLNLSHDIRTPINAVLGLTQIALLHLDNQKKVKDCLEKINMSTGYLLKMINKVLDVSRIQSGKIELENEKISLKEIIQDMLDMTQDDVRKKQLTRTVDMEEFTEEWVYGDKARIQQIFLNLMTNGIKYTDVGGNLYFKAATLPKKYGKYNTYQFIFKDNGIGMSREFLNKVFEPFSREENKCTQNIQGTGLGLNIVKSIVELMQGNVIIESEPGKGSCFQIYIRLKPLEMQQKNKKEAKEDINEVIKQKRYPGVRILLAEDNEINREIAAELISYVDIEVDEAENGVQAVKKFADRPEQYYQMILMDIQMPEMNGYEATDLIRKIEQKRKSRIPILALTSSVFDEDRERVLQHGMDAHIGKPIALPKLIHILDEWLKIKDS